MTPAFAERPARLLIVDDHPIVRLGVRQMIAPEPRLAICGEEVLAGCRYVSTRLSQALLERLDPHARTRSGSLDELSDREIEVFRLIGRGLNTAAIAERLGVSVKTIETCRSNVKLKLGLTDATDLIRTTATWVEGL